MSILTEILTAFSPGRVINVSSVKGRIATAFCGAYSSAKFAGTYYYAYF